MIRLLKTDGKIYRFSLKNKKREKSFRDAWYAMGDMPNKKNQKLKVQTIKGNEYIFVEGEISQCEYIDKTHEGEEIQHPIPKIYENSEKNEYPELKTGRFSPSIIELMEQMKSAFDNIPVNKKLNALLFFEGLKNNNIPLDLNDNHLAQSLAKVLEAESDDIPFLVQEYIKYWKNRS